MKHLNPSELLAIHPGYLNGLVGDIKAQGLDKQQVQDLNAKVNVPTVLTIESDASAEDGLTLADFSQVKLDRSEPIAAQIPKSERLSAVAVIPIKGVMQKYGSTYHGRYWFETSTKQVLAELDACRGADVTGCVLSVDSGGGQVDGNYLLAQAIALHNKKHFPVLGHVDGMAASAAYQVIAQADKIYTASPTDYVGSIGVYMTHVSMEKMLEEYGLEYTYIVADGGENKVIGPRTHKLSEEDYEKLKAEINPLRTIMVDQIKQGRGERLGDNPDILSGSIFPSKQAKSYGMIDGIKSFEATALEAFRMGRKRKKENSTKGAAISVPSYPNSNHSDTMLKQFLAGTFGLTLADEKQEPITLSPEQQTQITTAFNDKVTALNGQVNTLTEAKAGLETQVTDLTAERDNLNTQVATLTTERDDLKGQLEAAQAAQPEGLAEGETVEGIKASLSAAEAGKTAAEQAKADAEAKYEALLSSYNSLASTYGAPAYEKLEEENNDEGKGAGSKPNTAPVAVEPGKSPLSRYTKF